MGDQLHKSMSLCVKTLYHTFPGIKAFGCCHEVFGTQKVLKGILEEEYGLQDIKREDIHVNVLGINHFTWFDYASYMGWICSLFTENMWMSILRRALRKGT